jgi:hypothetical protein
VAELVAAEAAEELLGKIGLDSDPANEEPEMVGHYSVVLADTALDSRQVDQIDFVAGLTHFEDTVLKLGD